MKKAIINGIELCYRDAGHGPPLVFLHAFPLNQSMWNGQFDRFSMDHRVVTFDWRGFGQSSLGPEPSTLDSFASDLAGLLDHLEIEKAVICGLSMGGYATFAFLRAHAHRLAGLILADTRSTPDTEQARQARIETAARVRRDGPASLLPGMTEKLLGKTTLAGRPDIVERINAIIRSGNSEGIAQALLAMAARPDSSDLLAGIACPTLFICGEEDTLTPTDESERMSRAVPGSRLEIIRNAGHLPNIEKNDVFNDTVSRFLTSITVGFERT